MTEQTKIRWTYDDRKGEHVAEYRGFQIRAVIDQDCENPFTAWDCEPPTMVYSGRSDWNDYSEGEVAKPLDAMSDGQVSRHWRAICKALDLSEEQHAADVRETQEADRHNARRGYLTIGARMHEIRRDLFGDALSDLKHGNAGDYLETLAALWRIAGCIAETWSSNGYSQGDWAEGLSVATPAWVEVTGAPKSSHKAQMVAAGKMWGSWAWGDVYGFIIDALPDDSCFGFYGSDFADSGLEEGATSAIDVVLAHRRQIKQSKLATLIKARVPLANRAAILAPYAEALA